MTQEITFWVLAVIAVLGALVAVRRRNLIHGVFALMIFFAALAGLFLLLLAEFIAAVQILVYIGAVGILLLFVIMLTERVTGDDARDITSRGSFWGWAAVLALDGGHPDLEGLSGDAALDSFVFAGDSGMVRDVWSGGRAVVSGGRHIRRDAITDAYRRAVRDLRRDA